MGKEENLKKRKKFVKSDEKALKDGLDPVENGRKGGIASGKAKAEKKLIKNIWQAILNSEIQDESYVKNEIEKYPFLDKEQITNAYVFSKDIIEILRRRRKVYLKDSKGEAIVDEKGQKQKVDEPYYSENARLKAYEIIMNYSGQKPVEKQEVTNIDADGYRRILMGDEDIFEGDYGSANEDEEETEE